MHIQFIRNYRAYSTGDVAGFDPSVAEVLIQKRIAVLKQWGEDPAPQIEVQGQTETDEGEALSKHGGQADPADPGEDAKTETQEKARGRRK